MIILGTPKADELNNYFIADGELAFTLHQKNFIPKYKDEEGCLYFKLNKKLIEALRKLNVEI